MKKLLWMLLIGGLFAAMPALAAEQKMAGDHKMMSVEEHAQLCSVQSQTIDQKIKRLQSEIKKGKTTYNAEDLRKLEQKLKDANYLLDSITGP